MNTNSTYWTVKAWNEAEELHCSLRELNDDELVDCRQALLTRAEKIMLYMGHAYYRRTGRTLYLDIEERNYG